MIITINEYESYGDAFGDYLHKKHGETVKHISFFKKPKQRFQSKAVVAFNLVKAFFLAFIRVPILYNNKCFCTGCQITVMLLYRIFSPFLGTSHLYIYNFYLHGASQMRGVKRFLKFVLNSKRITLILQSLYEIDYYREISNQVRLEFVPYCSDFFPSQNRNVLVEGAYYFSGGYTNRDYRLVNELAQRHPDKRFVIIASNLNMIKEVADNVTLIKDVNKDLFEATLSHSEGVIIPLLENVGSSGQMLCISAIRNKKPIIYTDMSSINYYFPENCGYPYEMGNIESLNSAFVTLTNNMEEAKQKGIAAYKNSLKFTSEYCHGLLYAIIKED